MTTTKTRGEKYNGARDIAETAKLIRADIRAAQKEEGSTFSGANVAVKISRYSGGQSVNVRVTFDAAITSPFWIENRRLRDAGDQAAWKNVPARYLASIEAAKAQIEEICASYNRSEIDHASDYYNTHFTANVDISTTALESY
jgi:hypothetical protein